MRRFRLSVLVALAALLIATPVLAYSYTIAISLSNDSSTDYTGVPILLEVNNTQLAELGYIDADGMNTAVYEGSSERVSMVTNNRLGLFVPSILNNQELDYVYRLGTDTDRTTFPLIVGEGGNVTVSDDADLEPGDNFSFNFTGYLGSEGNLMSKGNLLRLSYGEGLLESSILGDPDRTTNITPLATGSWETIDVSSYVPEDASGALILGRPDHYIDDWGVRPAGSTNDVSGSGSTARSAFVGLDASGTFEAYREYGDDYFYLVGYVTDGWNFRTNWVDVSLGSSGSWEDVDVSSYVSGNAVAALLEVHNNGPSRDFGLRPNGSDYNHVAELLGGHQVYLIVGLDSNGVYEMYIEDTGIDHFLVGYIDEDFELVDTPVDKAPGSADTWTELDCSAEAPGATALFFDCGYVTQARDFRQVGDTASYIDNGSRHDGALVPVPVEARISDTGVGMNLTAYATDNVYFMEPPVTVSAAVSSGVHDINLTADGTDFSLWVDGVEEDSVALDGRSIPGSSYDWELFSDNTAPYVSSYKHYVSGSLVAWYEPNTMISGTVLTDRQGGDENGSISWGSNNGDLTATLGALESVESFTSPASDITEAPDVSPSPAIDWHGNTGADMSEKIGYDSVSKMAESLGMPVQRAYGVFALFVAIALGFAAAIAVGSMWGFTVLFGLTVGTASTADYLPLWMAMTAILFAFFLSMVWTTR